MGIPEIFVVNDSIEIHTEGPTQLNLTVPLSSVRSFSGILNFVCTKSQLLCLGNEISVDLSFVEDALSAAGDSNSSLMGFRPFYVTSAYTVPGDSVITTPFLDFIHISTLLFNWPGYPKTWSAFSDSLDLAVCRASSTAEGKLTLAGICEPAAAELNFDVSYQVCDFSSVGT